MKRIAAVTAAVALVMVVGAVVLAASNTHSEPSLDAESPSLLDNPTHYLPEGTSRVGKKDVPPPGSEAKIESYRSAEGTATGQRIQRELEKNTESDWTQSGVSRIPALPQPSESAADRNETASGPPPVVQPEPPSENPQVFIPSGLNGLNDAASPGCFK